MVGGFSFYERAEIKDLLGYLRLIRNPHDSMALQRVINTPTRGIGKTTLETLERLALETGASTWDAVSAAIQNRLIPTRALMAIESFRQLILDAQAMMDPDFAGKLSADVAESSASDADTGFDFGSAAIEPESPELESAEAHFGGDENQIPLLNSGHFSRASGETTDASEYLRIGRPWTLIAPIQTIRRCKKCQGTTSVVPQAMQIYRGFSPCGENSSSRIQSKTRTT